MDKHEMIIAAEPVLAALDKLGIWGEDKRTAALVLAAAVVNGFRSSRTTFVVTLPLTSARRRVSAEIRIEDDVEVTSGEFIPEGKKPWQIR